MTAPASRSPRGRVHIPLRELPRRLDEVPSGEIWVHCRAGYRSTATASLPAALGRDAISIDDEIGNAMPAVPGAYQEVQR
jgi:hydroxyacylglutathione hydrolase